MAKKSELEVSLDSYGTIISPREAEAGLLRLGVAQERDIARKVLEVYKGMVAQTPLIGVKHVGDYYLVGKWRDDPRIEVTLIGGSPTESSPSGIRLGFAFEYDGNAIGFTPVIPDQPQNDHRSLPEKFALSHRNYGLLTQVLTHTEKPTIHTERFDERLVDIGVESGMRLFNSLYDRTTSAIVPRGEGGS